MEENDEGDVIFQDKMCIFCGIRRNIEIVQTKPSENHPHKTTYLCNEHHKMWIKQAKAETNTYLTVEEIVQGLSKRRKDN